MASSSDSCFRGLRKTTLLDFPGHVSCVLFAGGCSFNCVYCYNRSLVKRSGDELAWPEVWAFLNRRKTVLSGLCVSGGEPLIHEWMLDFLHEARRIGYKTKLDTNGNHPAMLAQVLRYNLVDFVAMDIKNSPEKYAATCGLGEVDLVNITDSVKLIKESGVDYEFRTTLCRELTNRSDIDAIARFVGGGKRFSLQPVLETEPTLSGRLFTPPAPDVLREMGKILDQHFAEVQIRGI